MNQIYTQALLGWALIGLAAFLFAGGLGRVMGISGIIKGILPRPEKDGSWRYLFLFGIVLWVSLYAVIRTDYVPSLPANATPLLAVISGIFVWIGTSLANGCTSGHAVCGLGRLSRRSIIATVTFVTTGILTVFITHYTVLWKVLSILS